MSEESKTYVIPTIMEAIGDSVRMADNSNVDFEGLESSIKKLIEFHLKTFADIIHRKETVFLSMEGSYYEPLPEEILAIYPLDQIK